MILTLCFYLGSRYIYDLYYEKEAISKQLYDWLLKNSYADANLIAKWKKQGYEKVSCAYPSLPKLWYGLGRTAPFFRASVLYHFSAILANSFFSTAMLSSMRPNKRDQFQFHLHLPRTQGPVEGGADHPVCQLRLSRLCEQRLEMATREK